LFNPLPVGPDPLLLVLGLLCTAVGYLLVAGLLGLVRREREALPSLAVICVVLLALLFFVALGFLLSGRFPVRSYVFCVPLAYVGLVLAADALRRVRRGQRVRIRDVVAGLLVGLVMSMGFVIAVSVFSPWGWSGISLSELPSVLLFGLAGLGMILMGAVYLRLSDIDLLPLPNR